MLLPAAVSDIFMKVMRSRISEAVPSGCVIDAFSVILSKGVALTAALFQFILMIPVLHVMMTSSVHAEENIGGSHADFARGLREDSVRTVFENRYSNEIMTELSQKRNLSTDGVINAGVSDAVLSAGVALSAGRNAVPADSDENQNNTDVSSCTLAEILASPSVGRIRCPDSEYSSSDFRNDDGSQDYDAALVLPEKEMSGHCLLVHDFRAVRPVGFGDGIDFSECGTDRTTFGAGGTATGCTEFWLGNRKDNSLVGNCTVFENEISLEVEKPEAVKALILDTVHYDDYIRLLISVDGSPWRKVLNLPGNEFPPETPGRCELGKSGFERSETDLWPLISEMKEDSLAGEEDNGSRGFTLKLKQMVSVTGAGEGYMNFRLLYDGRKLIEKDSWMNRECLKTLQTDSDTILRTECLQRFSSDGGSSVTDGSCIRRNAVMICPDYFEKTSLFAGMSLHEPNSDAVWDFRDPLCMRLDVWAESADSSDVHGNEVPSSAADGDEAENNGFLPPRKPERLRGYFSADLGNAVSAGTFSDGTEASGILQDLGTELPEAYAETESLSVGTGLQDAVVALQALQYMQNDISCTGDSDSGRSCRIFRGTENSCRKGYFGRMDCCHAPNTSDVGTYIRLTSYMVALNTARASLENAVSSPGSWENYGLLGNSQGLVSGTADSILGSVMDTASEQATREFMQALTAKLAELVEQTMGEAAREALFTETVSTEGISMVEMNPAIAGTMQGVMAAYVAYQTYKTLEEIATSCRPGEIETSVKLKLDSCVHTGRSCREKVLGKCVLHDEHYCCFSSPLARIIMEQVPTGSGNGSEGICSGMPLSMMSELDFSGIDLSEWLRYVEDTGIADVGRMSVEGLTGDGNILNTGGRMNAVERTVERLEYTGKAFDKQQN